MFQVYANGRLLYRPGDPYVAREILNPKVSVKLGKAGAFSFTVPIGNKQYSALQQLKTTVSVKWDDREIFRGRVLTNARGFNTLRKVYCEGDLAYLIDSVQKGRKYDGKTHDLFRDIVARHNRMVEPEKQFQVGIIGIENRDIHIAGKNDDDDSFDTTDFDYRQIAINSIADEWQTSFNHIETCLINYCGGYLRSRRVGDVTYLDLIPDSGVDAAQTIQFGFNLLDLTDEVDVEDLFTVLIPLGDDNLTIESINDGSPEIVDAEGVATYGRIVKTHVFDGVSEASTLLENGNRYMQNNRNARYTIKVRAVDMHLLNPGIPAIEVGDRVMIRSDPHGIQIRLVCTEIEYDLDNPGNTIYIFGNPKQTLTDRYRKDKVKKSYGGGGGAAAPAEQARTDSQEALKEFYDAWINVDPASGHIDLGTLYQRYNELGEKVAENTTSIQTESTNLGARIDLNTKSITTLNGITTQHGTSIKTLSNNMEAQIEFNAASSKRVDDLENLESGHYSTLTIRANDLGSSISALSEKIDLKAAKRDVEAALDLKADATALDDYLKTTAAAEIYVNKDSVNAHIGAYILGNGQTIADVKADLIKLVGKTTVVGSLNVDSGNLYVDRAIVAQGAIYAPNQLISGGEMACADLRASSNFYYRDTLYEPTQITSTTGVVMALGCA